MADIAKCMGEGCPLKEKCYRYRAIPNKWRQSYIIEHEVEDCEHFWDITDKPEGWYNLSE